MPLRRTRKEVTDVRPILQRTPGITCTFKIAWHSSSGMSLRLSDNSKGYQTMRSKNFSMSKIEHAPLLLRSDAALRTDFISIVISEHRSPLLDPCTMPVKSLLDVYCSHFCLIRCCIMQSISLRSTGDGDKELLVEKDVATLVHLPLNTIRVRSKLVT